MADLQMANPIAVEATRGARVESRHRGAGAVFDADGASVLTFGDVETPIFPRSAVKALQALPLIESGAADTLKLSEAEIALVCASHSGEAVHVETARAMLAKAGLDESALACGVHWPLGEAAARALARSGAKPTALHNNCSGKHAGFLCLACASGWATKGYEAAGSPVQREVRGAIAAMTGAALGEEVCATDGCSIPTYAVPLRALALGFARLGTGSGLAPERAKAAARLRAAVAANPLMVAGEGKFDTEVMRLFGARVFVKTGAEGVYCAALPELGLGLAVKADDGATRAARIMIAALIDRFLPMDETERARFAPFVALPLRNWNGIAVGALRPVGALGEAPAP
jgi:L-asparaginase II